jgi:ribosomal protein S14
VVLGAGALHHVKALAALLPKGAALMVYEAHPEILAAALSRVALAELAPEGLVLRFASHSDLLPSSRSSEQDARPRASDVSLFAHRLHQTRRALQTLQDRLRTRCHLEARNRATVRRFSRNGRQQLAPPGFRGDSPTIDVLAGALEAPPPYRWRRPTLDAALPSSPP